MILNGHALRAPGNCEQASMQCCCLGLRRVCSQVGCCTTVVMGSVACNGGGRAHHFRDHHLLLARRGAERALVGVCLPRICVSSCKTIVKKRRRRVYTRSASEVEALADHVRKVCCLGQLLYQHEKSEQYNFWPDDVSMFGAVTALLAVCNPVSVCHPRGPAKAP